VLVVGWRELQFCPRRGRLAKASLIWFILLIFIAPERFGIFHLHALTACVLLFPHISKTGRGIRDDKMSKEKKRMGEGDSNP